MHLPWVLLAVLSPAAPAAEPETPTPVTATADTTSIARPSGDANASSAGDSPFGDATHMSVAQQKPKPKPKPKPDPDYCPPCGRG